eukprot:8583464-Lingulodinium_polyedra.AAC.1
MFARRTAPPRCPTAHHRASCTARSCRKPRRISQRSPWRRCLPVRANVCSHRSGPAAAAATLAEPK